MALWTCTCELASEPNQLASAVEAMRPEMDTVDVGLVWWGALQPWRLAVSVLNWSSSMTLSGITALVLHRQHLQAVPSHRRAIKCCTFYATRLDRVAYHL